MEKIDKFLNRENEILIGKLESSEKDNRITGDLVLTNRRLIHFRKIDKMYSYRDIPLEHITSIQYDYAGLNVAKLVWGIILVIIGAIMFIGGFALYILGIFVVLLGLGGIIWGIILIVNAVNRKGTIYVYSYSSRSVLDYPVRDNRITNQIPTFIALVHWVLYDGSKYDRSILTQPQTYAQPETKTYAQSEPQTYAQPEPQTYAQPEPQTYAQPEPQKQEIRKEEIKVNQPEKSDFNFEETKKPIIREISGPRNISNEDYDFNFDEFKDENNVFEPDKTINNTDFMDFSKKDNPSGKNCQVCGAKLAPGSKFCTECGEIQKN